MEERGLLLADVLMAAAMFALTGVGLWGMANYHTHFDPRTSWDDFFYLVAALPAPAWFCIGVGALNRRYLIGLLVGVLLSVVVGYFTWP